MSPAPLQTGTSPDVAASALLRGKLAALRQRHLMVAVLTGAGLALAIGVEILALAMFLDWWLEMPWGVRLALLLGQLAVQAWILTRFVFLPVLRQPDEDTLALMVERARPEFRSRLISAIQLSRPGAMTPGTATDLVGSLIEETESMSRAQDFRAIVPTDRLQKITLLALSVALMAVAGMAYGRATCWDLLQRAFLSNIPVPRKTQVVVIDGDKTIGQGDAVRLEAYANGIIPETGTLEIKYRNRRTQELPLEQNTDNPRHFGRTLENIQASFTYVIRLNDGTSMRHEVRALPRPMVREIDCIQFFPAYTGLQPVPRPIGDLVLLAGSRLQLDVNATKDIQSAFVHLVGPDQREPLQVDGGDRHRLTGSFQVPKEGLNGFSIELLDTENMASLDPAVYRVEILPDKPPKVDITHPERKEELVTRLATLLVGMRIRDDFEIRQVSLHYKVDTLDDNAEKTIPLELGTNKVFELQRAFPWDLGTMRPPLAEGSLIEFWIEAVDSNDTTGPGVGSSLHQLARVVSRDEKLADILNRASDYLSGLEDVAEDQARANRNLGEYILQKVESGPRP